MGILICFLLVKYGDVYGFEDSFGHLGKILWFLKRFSKQQNYVAFSKNITILGPNPLVVHRW